MQTKEVSLIVVRTFDQQVFVIDLNREPLHVTCTCEKTRDTHWAYDRLFLDVINKHAPTKLRKRHKQSVSFMNNVVQKAIQKQNVCNTTYSGNFETAGTGRLQTETQHCYQNTQQLLNIITQTNMLAFRNLKNPGPPSSLSSQTIATSLTIT